MKIFGKGLQKLRETSEDTIFRTPYDAGKVGIVKVEYPAMNLSIFEILKQKEHHIQLKNDIYETATIEGELECTITLQVISEANQLEKRINSYEYASESYESYLESKIQISKPRTAIRKLYENDDFSIFVEKEANQANRFLWYCLFKSPDMHSVRELTDLNMLDILKKEIYRLIKEAEVPEDRVCLFFDYQGKCSQLVLNIADVTNGINNLKAAGKFIYFDTLLKNLSVNISYYRGDVHYIKHNLVPKKDL